MSCPLIFTWSLWQYYRDMATFVTVLMNEAQVHANICDYIRLQYPKALFNSDLSGLKMTIGQAVKVKKLRSSRAYPDLMIFEPRGTYSGLFLELKRDGEKLSKRSGEWKTEHLAEQSQMIQDLVARGYYANFAIGFDSAKTQIDRYMKLPLK